MVPVKFVIQPEFKPNPKHIWFNSIFSPLNYIAIHIVYMIDTILSGFTF